MKFVNSIGDPVLLIEVLTDLFQGSALYPRDITSANAQFLRSLQLRQRRRALFQPVAHKYNFLFARIEVFANDLE